MHIAIDLQSCQSGSRLGGIGRYSLELAKAMLRRGTAHRFTLLLSDAAPDAGAHVRAAVADLIPPDEIRTIALPRRASELGTAPAMVRAAELVREQYLADLAPDFVHVTSLFEGLLEDIVTSVGAVFPAERTAVTLYDLIPLVQRERYLQDKRALEHYLNKLEHLKKAGLLLAISDFSRLEAHELLGIELSRMVDISSAADSRFRKIDLDPRAVRDLKQRYGIDDQFLMYTASFDQRKNQAALIRAFARVPRAARANHQLLIVGNGWDAVYAQLRLVAQEAGLEPTEVVFAGHVAEADLVPLYNACRLFVFPSLAEGFGLPVLEAMSCGTPTICSNTTSLPEVIGLKEAMFDPTNEGEIAAHIERALIDPAFDQLLRLNGLERAKLFSWDESARRTLEAMEAHHAQLSAPHKIRPTPSFSENAQLAPVVERLAKLPRIAEFPLRALDELSRCLAANNLSLRAAAAIDAGAKSGVRTGWVSTWNTRCGIASYSKFLVDQWPGPVTVLAPFAEWTAEPDGANVVRCWENGRLADDLDQLFRAITRASLELVVIQFNYGFFELGALARLINRLTDLGVRVVVALHSTQDDPPRFLRDIAPALARCATLVVHSAADANTLGKLGLNRNVLVLPHGIVAVPPTPTHAREGGEKVIATYGFALPNKGLLEVVEAFALMRKQATTPLRLVMVNAEYPATVSAEVLATVCRRVEELGLEDIVELHSDFLPDARSIELLRRADVIVNAYQHTGESASGAVRIALASGRPVAVTPLAIFNDVKSCTFTLPGTNPTDIANGLHAVLEQLDQGTAHAKEIETNALRWRAAHDFKRMAKACFVASATFLPPGEELVVNLDFDLSPRSKPVDYPGAHPALKTVVGVLKGDRLVSTARRGHLLHGPYISVAEGEYRARVSGRLSGAGLANIDVCARGGAVVFSNEPLKPNGTSMLAELRFQVPEGGVNDLEVRIEVDAGATLELSRLQLEPVT